MVALLAAWTWMNVSKFERLDPNEIVFTQWDGDVNQLQDKPNMLECQWTQNELCLLDIDRRWIKIAMVIVKRNWPNDKIVRSRNDVMVAS